MEHIVNLKKKADTIKLKPKSLSPYYSPKDKQDDTLVFESRFESGNLLAAKKVSTEEYHLFLQRDTNTLGYTQWFFFRVSNTKKDKEIWFNIVNMVR